MQGIQNAAQSSYGEPQLDTKPIPAAAGDLSFAGAYLASVVDLLAQRLKPLLAPEEVAGETTPEPAYSSEFAQRLRGEARFIRGQADRIHSLLSCLEI